MSSFSLTCFMDPAENFLKNNGLLHGSPKGEHSIFSSQSSLSKTFLKKLDSFLIKQCKYNLPSLLR